jgi:serine/threonine protein kinase
VTTELNYGRQVGPHEINDILGRGGMAVVYKARQPSLDRFVALKVLAPELSRDAEFVARFRAEATTAARLEHPHIVPIYEVGQADETQFIAMRYVAGGTLAELLSRTGPLPLATTVALVTQIASALDYAHLHDVVHRDLKPGNILLEVTGDRASLTDFGIARAGEGSRFTRLGQAAGTPEYMAPEQAQGATVDSRADLYSLGIVAYEMLSGRVPFQADSGIAVLHQQVYSPPPPLGSLRPDIPAAVNSAVERILSKNPAERFPTGAAFVAALQASSTPVSLPVITGSRPSRDLPSRRRSTGLVLPLAAAAGALTLIVGVLVLASRPAAAGGGGPVIERPSPFPTQTIAPTATTAVLHPTQAPPPTIAPTIAPTSPPTAVPTPTATLAPIPPELAANDFSPKVAQSGDRFTLTYEITGSSGAPVRVLLGASIRPSGGGAAIDDPANDESVTIQPGRAVYQRIFRVPPGTPPGRYDVLWGLIGPDRQNFGLHTDAGALLVVAQAPAASQPVSPPVIESPATVVREFYTLIGQRNFRAAWDMLSPQRQRSLIYSSWVAGFDVTRSVDVQTVSVLTQSAGEATVAATVGSVDADTSGRSVRKVFQVTCDLVFTAGSWKLQSSTMKQTS